MLKRLLVFLSLGMLLLCTSLPVNAASWYYVGKSRQNQTYFIDNSSVIKRNGYAKVWVKINDSDGSSSIMRISLNRFSRTMGIYNSIDYNSYGQIVNSNDFYGRETPIVPGSVGEGLLNVIW